MKKIIKKDFLFFLSEITIPILLFLHFYSTVKISNDSMGYVDLITELTVIVVYYIYSFFYLFFCFKHKKNNFSYFAIRYLLFSLYSYVSKGGLLYNNVNAVIAILFFLFVGRKEKKVSRNEVVLLICIVVLSIILRISDIWLNDLLFIITLFISGFVGGIFAVLLVKKISTMCFCVVVINQHCLSFALGMIIGVLIAKGVSCNIRLNKKCISTE